MILSFPIQRKGLELGLFCIFDGFVNKKCRIKTTFNESGHGMRFFFEEGESILFWPKEKRYYVVEPR